MSRNIFVPVLVGPGQSGRVPVSWPAPAKSDYDSAKTVTDFRHTFLRRSIQVSTLDLIRCDAIHNTNGVIAETIIIQNIHDTQSI